MLMNHDDIIPVDDAIERFQNHLLSHDRVILSAKFGDGKSFFLNEFRKKCEDCNDSGDVCKPVYDLILKVMEENIEKQKNAEIYHMRELFDKDLQAFTQLFIPNNQESPKFIMTPMLHLLDENAIEKKINP